jgi:hypothetical protein
MKVCDHFPVKNIGSFYPATMILAKTELFSTWTAAGQSQKLDKI